MATVDIRIPQLGEGLQEARLIRFLKQAGEKIAKDEPIYEMETDKAVMEIESPTAGIIESWDAKEDDVLPIGAVIGRISADSAPAEPLLPIPSDDSDRSDTSDAPATPGTQHPSPTDGLRAGAVPPRTRAYAKEKGLSEEDLTALAAGGGKVMPEDIDRYLSTRTFAKPRDAKPAGYADLPLPQRQRTLVYRLQRGAREVIPATMEMRVAWDSVEQARGRYREKGGDLQPTQFILFAWCVAQASRNHPAFRSALLNDSTIRQYEHLHLGIAVAREKDELLLARIPVADSLGFEEFVRAAQDSIRRAREGEDQTAETMQLSLTNMAGAGVRFGIPVLVAPAVGTLFIGAPFDEACPLPGGGIGFRRLASMVMSFDHRIANGIGAANFLSEVRSHIENLGEELAES